MGFGALCEHVLASGRIGTAKPEPGFFAATEAWSGLGGRDILLIDDSRPIIEACLAHGWEAFHFTPATRGALPHRLGLEQ